MVRWYRQTIGDMLCCSWGKNINKTETPSLTLPASKTKSAFQQQYFFTETKEGRWWETRKICLLPFFMAHFLSQKIKRHRHCQIPVVVQNVAIKKIYILKEDFCLILLLSDHDNGRKLGHLSLLHLAIYNTQLQFSI